MEWMKQFSLAIDYIENNLEGDISYEEAAKIACCSTYYFQRMFTYVVGISISDYIRRRRMTQAAFELQSSKAKIMDIGMKYGYASPTSFNRAFQSVHSVAPNISRQQGTKLNAYPRLSFSIHIEGNEGINYRIEIRESIRIVGVRVLLENDVEENFKIVPTFWEETLRNNIIPEIWKLSNQNPQGILGVSDYKDPKEIYYYIAAATDLPVPKGMFEFEISEATWVVLECDGNYPDSIHTIYKKFFTEWLPFSGYECGKMADIEVYNSSNPKFEKVESGQSELWIAINKSEK